MTKNNLSLMLVYEPETTHSGPIPVLRLSDETLTLAVAKTAVLKATMRAQELFVLDEVLGQMEELEVQKLRNILSLLLPQFLDKSQPDEAKTLVM